MVTYSDNSIYESNEQLEWFLSQQSHCATRPFHCGVLSGTELNSEMFVPCGHWTVEWLRVKQWWLINSAHSSKGLTELPTLILPFVSAANILSHALRFTLSPQSLMSGHSGESRTQSPWVGWETELQTTLYFPRPASGPPFHHDKERQCTLEFAAPRRCRSGPPPLSPPLVRHWSLFGELSLVGELFLPPEASHNLFFVTYIEDRSLQ